MRRSPMMLTTLVALLWLPSAGWSQTTTDRTFDVERGARVEVHNPFGDVHIRGWNRSAVRVRADHDRGVAPRIESGGSWITIHPGGRPRRESPIDYTIDVPVSAGVLAHVVEGDVVVEGTTAPIEAHSVRGDVRVQGGTRAVLVQSVQGSVEVTGARGRVEVQAVNDGVVLNDVVGETMVEVVNGSIRLSGVRGSNVEANSVNGPITWSGALEPDGLYRFSSHNGDIEVAVPQGDGAVVRVSTFNGTLRSDFPVTLREGQSGKRFTFTLGSGGSRLELETFNGTIRLRRP